MQPPPSIAFLVDAVGEDAVLCLLEAEGGKTVWVPLKPEGSQLANAYGEDLVRALCHELRGGAWLVPMCKSWRVTRYRQMGMTINDIATRCGLSKRQVLHIIQAARKRGIAVPRPPKPVDPRQPSLF